MHDEARLFSKLTLEAELARPVVQILSGYTTTWGQSGGAVPMLARIQFAHAMQVALERHYARVTSAILGAMPSPETSLDDFGALDLSIDHAERMRARAQHRAVYMVERIDRDLARAFSLTPDPSGFKATLADLESKAGEDKRPFSIGLGTRFQATAMQAFYKIRAKLRTMVNAETQEPAEQAMFEWVRRKKGNAPLVKVWVDMDDARVRASHSDAGERYTLDGAIPVDQPFELAGGRLMFPGDTSMGVSMREIYNCRCHNTYYAITPEGAVPLDIAMPSIPAKRPWRPGDRFGEEIPIRATEVVTLNGRTRARVVLGDNRTIATLTQPSPSAINVSIDGRVIARASHHRGEITSLTIAEGREALGIERLIRESVTHSWGRRPQ